MGRTLQRNPQQRPTNRKTRHTNSRNGIKCNTNPPSEVEISRALKMKADAITTTYMLHHLFLKIWEQEKVPTQWKNGYLVKLPKKGDLGMCRNWRGITLLSVRSKVFTRILLDRMKGTLDERLREEQADFRKKQIMH